MLFRSGSPIKFLKISSDTYSSHKISVEVSRASQVHQIPHTGCAQIGPVISTTVLNAMPTSAADTASQSHFGLRAPRYAMFATNTTVNAISATIPLGA